MEYDATAVNPALKVNVLDPGASLTISVQGSRYSLILVEPGADPSTDTGAFVAANNTITMTSDDAEEDVLVFAYTRDGNFVTLNTEGVFFPETSIPAKLKIILKKIS